MTKDQIVRLQTDIAYADREMSQLFEGRSLDDCRDIEVNDPKYRAIKAAQTVRLALLARLQAKQGET